MPHSAGTSRSAWRALLAAGLTTLTLGAQAALFEDDEARRAILELRQRFTEETQKGAQAQARAAEDNAQLRRSLLELSNQVEQLRAEISRLTGQNEQMGRSLADVQRQLKDTSNGIEDRLRRVEPTKVTVDGREFVAEPSETRDFEAALASMRRGEFAKAQTAFASFVQRYPSSGYKPSAQFWLGNAQYALGSYKEALATLRSMLATAPDHARAPEAKLAVANAQLELKEPRAAVRKTLEELIKSHPDAEAATVAKDRLAKLK